MTRVLADILKEPAQLSASLAHAVSIGAVDMKRAASLLRAARSVLIVGIGASWHAGMVMQAILHGYGVSAVLMDASELLYFGEVPKGAVVVMLSRSGRSIEIVRLVEKCKNQSVVIVAITNNPESSLALEADVSLNTSTDFDHSVSISTYSAIALTAALLALNTAGQPVESLAGELRSAIHQTANSIEGWRAIIKNCGWLDGNATTYFLARGTSLGSAHEARLLWEETAKAPATALTTGGFRHGPQEIVREGLRVAMWIDAERLRVQDLTLAADLERLGAHVLLIGQDLDSTAPQCVIKLPSVPAALQFAIDIIPAQIAAESLAELRGEDCDNFRLCSYIVEDEGGLCGSEESPVVAGEQNR
jgi:glutamine---fructose-6-phosphate transaminase (isomerizing)